jgi:UDP-N-acetylglucosamine 2-epimerase
LKSNYFLIWGNSDYEFFSKFGIPVSKLKITGSARHDSFFASPRTRYNSKTVLLALSPLTDRHGWSDTNLAIKYEEQLTNIINIIKNISGAKIIVKLHPGENWHNLSLLEFFKKNYKDIPIYQIRSPKNVIQSSDLTIHISPYSFDLSTIMLESMILNKPTMLISLDEQFKNIEYDNDSPIVGLSYRANVEKYLKKILYDDEFRQTLLQKNKFYLKKFLANHGNASQKIAEMIT